MNCQTTVPVGAGSSFVTRPCDQPAILKVNGSPICERHASNMMRRIALVNA